MTTHPAILESQVPEPEDIQRYPAREKLRAVIQRLIDEGHIVPASDSALTKSPRKRK